MKKLSKDALATLEEKTKVKSIKKEKADSITTAAVAKKITKEKNLKYIYPKNCDTIETRKAYRAKLRKDLKNLEKKLRLTTKGKIEGKPESVEKEILAFKKEHFPNKA